MAAIDVAGVLRSGVDIIVDGLLRQMKRATISMSRKFWMLMGLVKSAMKVSRLRTPAYNNIEMERVGLLKLIEHSQSQTQSKLAGRCHACDDTRPVSGFSTMLYPTAKTLLARVVTICHRPIHTQACSVYLDFQKRRNRSWIESDGYKSKAGRWSSVPWPDRLWAATTSFFP